VVLAAASMKRRQPDSRPALIDDDLHRRRARAARHAAVVFLIMDVSASMTEADRRLAKSFFFWAVQGLRREYRHLDTAFIAHTTEAWEFSEEQFFQVSGSGGTVASAGLLKALQLIGDRYSPARYNVYVFYASDGDNAPSDRDAAAQALHDIAADASYCGYLEVTSTPLARPETETARIFPCSRRRAPAGSCVTRPEDIWSAVRHFFAHEAARGPAERGT
jgi:hypothetical protein